MSVSARPQAKFAAAALAAAGVMSAATATSLPAQQRLPVSVDVTNAAAVTDTLHGLGTGVAFLDAMVGIHVDAVISLPFEASLAVLAAAEHPEVAPNVLSYLVQRFVNPAVGPPISAYPYETEQAFANLASVLPYPLGPSASQPGLVNEGRLAFADVFNSVLSQLPDPMPGYEAVQDVSTHTSLGGAIVATQNVVRAPLYAAWSAADYLGNVPLNLATTPDAPGQLPRVVGDLVHVVLSPPNRSPEANALSTSASSVVGVQRRAVPSSLSSPLRTLTKPLETRRAASDDADASAADSSAVKVRASGPKHRATGQSIKDRLSRVLTRHEPTKPASSGTAD